MTTTRQKRTPAEKAQEALDVAQRRVNNLRRKLALARTSVLTLEGEVADAERYRDYLATSPNLPQTAASEEG